MEAFTNLNQKVLQKTFQNYGTIISNILTASKGHQLRASEASQTIAKLERVVAEQTGQLGMLRRVASKLRSDISALEDFKTTALQEKIESKFKSDGMLATLGEITSREQLIQIENKRLRERVAFLEKNEQLKDLMEQRKVLIDSYNTLVAELRADNSVLQNELSACRTQVEKLTGALYEKAHFSTFVDLKSENIKLQNKLNEVMKKVEKNGLGAITNLNTKKIVNNDNANNIIIANPNPPVTPNNFSCNRASNSANRNRNLHIKENALPLSAGAFIVKDSLEGEQFQSKNEFVKLLEQHDRVNLNPIENNISAISSNNETYKQVDAGSANKCDTFIKLLDVNTLLKAEHDFDVNLASFPNQDQGLTNATLKPKSKGINYKHDNISATSNSNKYKTINSNRHLNVDSSVLGTTASSSNPAIDINSVSKSRLVI